MISMKNICDYAGTNPEQRKFIEGERVYKAKFIIKCGKTGVSEDSGTTSISAVCLQTTAVKNKNPHEINGEISLNGDVLHFQCTCKAGLGEKCKHIIATLLYIYQKGDDLEVLSCTDKKCGWKQDHSKALEEYDAAPLMQHSCFAEPTVKTKKIINASSIKNCLEPEQYEVIAENEVGEMETLQSNQSSSGSQEAVILKKKRKPAPEIQVSELQLSEIASIIRNQLPMSALAKHELGRHDPIVLREKSKVSQAEKEVIKIILDAQDSDTMQYIQKFEVPVLQDCCLNTIDHLSHDLQTISENTKDHYAHWIRERQYRITGSICYGLYTFTKLKRSEVEWKKKFQSTFAPKDFKTAAMEHGNLTESEARNAFRKVINCEVVEVGLIVSRLNPWLAYSPDGILTRKNKPIALLEIKCPMAGKSAGIQETVNSQIKKCLVQEGENILMKEKHAYYGQIQLGMAVLNLPVTYFVIYSPFDKNLFTLRVGRNDLFITTMLKALKKVYFAHRLHDICLIKEDCDNTASKQLEVESTAVQVN